MNTKMGQSEDTAGSPALHVKPTSKGKVVVAMSGGVDSSVAAALLKREGYEVVGCFMRLGSEDEAEIADGYDNMSRNDVRACRIDQQAQQQKPKVHKQGCCSVNDAADARLVAAMLDVPFYVVNFKKDFGRIMDYFVAEYNAGRTPNPCVRCNDWLKFGKLHQYAQSIDADWVASGHYARMEHRPTGPALLRGVDHKKDQSYVLFGAPRQQLQHMLLPVGGFTKDVIRDMAEDFDLPVFNKPDSQEICFVPDNDYAKLVERRSPDEFKPGKIVNAQGEELGEHDGHQHFTVGQRRGLGISNTIPLYVLNRDPDTNTVVVGARDELASTGCAADQTNWLIDPPYEWEDCLVKVRYNSQPTPGKVRATGDDALEVEFDEPLDAVTPGQAVVCYHGDQVIGGGWITTANAVESAN